MPRRSLQLPPEFAEVYGRWRSFEITQIEAARELNVVQSTFSNWKTKYEADNGLEPRGPSPAPDGFDEVFRRYENHEITCREAGRLLGVSHSEFLHHAKLARAEAREDAREQSLERKVSELSERHDDLDREGFGRSNGFDAR